MEEPVHEKLIINCNLDLKEEKIPHKKIEKKELILNNEEKEKPVINNKDKK